VLLACRSGHIAVYDWPWRSRLWLHGPLPGAAVDCVALCPQTGAVFVSRGTSIEHFRLAGNESLWERGRSEAVHGRELSPASAQPVGWEWVSEEAISAEVSVFYAVSVLF